MWVAAEPAKCEAQLPAAVGRGPGVVGRGCWQPQAVQEKNLWWRWKQGPRARACGVSVTSRPHEAAEPPSTRALA